MSTNPGAIKTKRRVTALSLLAVLFLLASASQTLAGTIDIYTFTINSTPYSSTTTFSVSCTGLPSGTCAVFTPSQITVTSGPGSGATAETLALTGTADVATFANSSGEIWTFDLFTNKITGLGTYSFAGLSGLTEVGGPKSGYVSVSGQLKVTQAVAMPESGAFWSLLLVLIPTFLIGWRRDRTSNFESQVGLPPSSRL